MIEESASGACFISVLAECRSGRVLSEIVRLVRVSENHDFGSFAAPIVSVNSFRIFDVSASWQSSVDVPIEGGNSLEGVSRDYDSSLGIVEVSID